MNNLTIHRGEPYEHVWRVLSDFQMDWESLPILEAELKAYDEPGNVVFEATIAMGFAILSIDGGGLSAALAIHDTEALPAGEYAYTMTVRDAEYVYYVNEEGTLLVTDDPSGQTPVNRPVRPWDLFNPNIGRVDPVVKEERMSICRACPELHMGVCAKCGCVMRLKTGLPAAECPLGKWMGVDA